MEGSLEGSKLVAKARRFAERQYLTGMFDQAEKDAESIQRAGGSHAQIAGAYLRDARKLDLIDAEFVIVVFGEEVERHSRV